MLSRFESVIERRTASVNSDKESFKSVWHYHLSDEDKSTLDRLMGLALFDTAICRQLVINRDKNLMTKHGLSASAQAWLQALPATHNLTELAQAITQLETVQEAVFVPVAS